MTTEEKMMMQPTQEFIRKLQKKRNAGTDDCILSSDLAREIGITALDLHHYLIDVGFLFRERSTYELKLCKRYAGLGYAKTRSHFRYNSKGDLVETRFPVWTPKGHEYIKNLIQGKGHKDKETNKSKKKKNMKKNQKKSNLGRLVLTCTDLKDLQRQVQDDTELLGKKISGLIDQNCNWHSPYDQEVLTNVLTTILACVTELAERDAIPMRDAVVEKYDAWLELYRSKNK